MTRVLVTGIGAASPAAIGGRDALRAAAQGEPPRPTPLTGFDASTLPVQAAFLVPGKMTKLLKPYLKQRKSLKLMSQDARLAVLAAAHALTDAGLDPAARDAWPTSPRDVGLYMGVGLEPGEVAEVGPALALARAGSEARVELARLGGEGLDLIPPLSALKTLPNMALAHVSINFDLMGPGESLSCWSTAGLHAFAAATEAIERGECEVALVGAADSDVDFDALTTLIRTGVLTPLRADQAEALELWSLGRGWLVGEGGAFVVLESEAHAEARGARPLAAVEGGANLSLPPMAPGVMSSRGVEKVLTPLLGGARRCRVAGAAGHSTVWRGQEAEGLKAALAEAGGEAALEYPSRRHGACGCATALLDLVSLLGAEGDPSEDVAVLAWGPTGEYAAARLSRVELGGA